MPCGRKPVPKDRQQALLHRPAMLANIIRTLDFDGMRDYLWERYGVGVLEEHAADILFLVAQTALDRQLGTDWSGLEVQLKTRLYQLGYLSPLFVRQDEDPKMTWNPLHVFNMYGANGPPSWEDDEPEPEPQYARSKLSRTEVRVTPINKTAHSVAVPPGQREWDKISEGG